MKHTSILKIYKYAQSVLKCDDLLSVTPVKD